MAQAEPDTPATAQVESEKTEAVNSDAFRFLIVISEKQELRPALVWGLSAVERLRRCAMRMGALEINVLELDENTVSHAETSNWIVLRSDLFYDDRLMTGLRESFDVVLTDKVEGSSRDEALAAHVTGQQLPAAITALRGLEAQEAASPATPGSISPHRRVSKLDLAPAYNPVLRKFEEPFVFRAEEADTRKIENALFRASYKGVTDFVTKWVWPLPARAVVRRLAARGVRPNTVTAVGYLLTVLATWCFAEGWFASGLAAGWLMTFLDTVDGKLARCTLTSSKIGNVLDHGLDLVHPPFWWAAWAWGVSPEFADPGIAAATWIVVVGYVTGRLLEGVFLLFFKQELFTWRRFDIFFRTIIARRNPNLVLLTISLGFGRPDLGILAVAGWILVANLVPTIRIAQAFKQRRAGKPIRPWYEEVEEKMAEAP